MDEYQRNIVSKAAAREIHSKILDYTTQNTSAYDPDGLESLET